uniref:Uncharacterized protein n=1 Tax=Ananas comosus var. bracteatus TaxID=296719 RepID=A0A6V7NK04_ANACO|nr:unnamed protein product [Ananas comosus var. bracteatus]
MALGLSNCEIIAWVSSRTLHIPWDSAGCLCPVGDLFNYAAPDDEAIDNFNLRLMDGGYEEDTASYCFYARKKYEQGEQVLLGYGTYTNLELLEHYGFFYKTLLRCISHCKDRISDETSLCMWKNADKSMKRIDVYYNPQYQRGRCFDSIFNMFGTTCISHGRQFVIMHISLCLFWVPLVAAGVYS